MTGDDFSQWRRFMRLTKVAAANALGVGRNTILTYENSEQVPKHIELACAALACKIRSWSSVKKGEVVTVTRKELSGLSDRHSPSISGDEYETRMAFEKLTRS